AIYDELRKTLFRECQRVTLCRRLTEKLIKPQIVRGRGLVQAQLGVREFHGDAGDDASGFIRNDAAESGKLLRFQRQRSKQQKENTKNKPPQVPHFPPRTLHQTQTCVEIL